MPVTSYTDPGVAWSAWALQARTNAAGSAIDDAGGEDARLVLEAFIAGVFKTNDFRVLQNSPTGMSVLIGSGTAKNDVAIIQGTDAGQGKYAVRLGTATTAVTVPAAHATNPRIDQVFLVVQDNAYDSSSRVLPRIGYRQGDAAGSPSAPGPDAGWDAYLLIANIAVAAATSSILNANITDNRVRARVADELVDAGSLAVGTGAAISGLFEVDGSTEVAGPVGLTSSMANVASLVLSIPAGWGSWKCFAYATWVADNSTGVGFSYLARLTIDGTAQQTRGWGATFIDNDVIQDSGSVGARRTGMTTTGNRTIALQGQETANQVRMADIFLYARAVRTS